MNQEQYEDKSLEKFKNMEDGASFYNMADHCTLCFQTMVYYMRIASLHGKVLQGKPYCLDCYPKAVDIYLADKRLKKI